MPYMYNIPTNNALLLIFIQALFEFIKLNKHYIYYIYVYILSEDIHICIPLFLL